MAAEIKQIVEDAGKKLAEVIKAVTKNYIGFIVVEKLKPKLEGVIAEALADAKGGDGKEEVKEVKDAFPFEAPEVDEPDMFKFKIAGGTDLGYLIDYPRYVNPVIGYEVNCVRIGKQKSGLMALCRHYKIKYGQWLKLQDKLKDEKKDLVLPAIPPEYLLGTYCGCLTREWQPWHLHNMREWVDGVNKAIGTGSKAAADHFYMGENYQNQQIFKRIFDKAVRATARELRVVYYSSLPPFDEGEGVTLLCQLVIVEQFLPNLMAKLPANSPAVLQRNTAATLYAVIGAAMDAGWPPAQKVINEVKEGIAKVIDDGGAELASKLSEVFKKVLTLVQEKMKGDEKEEKADEKEEDKGVPIGAVVKDWKFQATGVGKNYYDDLTDAGRWANASVTLDQNWKGAMDSFFTEGITKAIGDACNPKFARSGIVQLVVEKFSHTIVNTFRRFTTVQPLLNAAKNFEKQRNDLIAALGAEGNKDGPTLCGLVNKASADMWQALPTSGLQLFEEFRRIRMDLRNDLRDQPNEALDALDAVCDHMFHIQMRAINALRADFTIKLKDKLTNDADARSSDAKIGEAARTIYRDSLFVFANIVVSEAWTQVASALVEVAIAVTLDKFFSSAIWGGITGGLEALQSLLPDVLKDKLDLPALAQTVVEKLLVKAVTVVMTKIFVKLEGALFKQG